jgi:2,3-bisphosphoglycerate-dependent phosphoglycerate mutase
MIEQISDEDITQFNIPTGIPLVYEFNENLSPIKQGFIGDEEIIKEASEAITKQGLAQ